MRCPVFDAHRDRISAQEYIEGNLEAPDTSNALISNWQLLVMRWII